MIFPNSTKTGGPIFSKKTPTGSKNAWRALLYAIGINTDFPVIGGKRVTATLNFPNTLTQTSSDLTIPCSGAQIGSPVIVGGPAPTAGSFYSGHIVTAGIVTVRFNNYSDNSINPGSAVFTAIVVPIE